MYKYPGSVLSLVGSDLERTPPLWLEPVTAGAVYSSVEELAIPELVDRFETEANRIIARVDLVRLKAWFAGEVIHSGLYASGKSYTEVVATTDEYLGREFLEPYESGVLADIYRVGGENTSRILMAAGTVACMGGLVGWRNRQSRYPERLQHAKWCLEGAWELAPSLRKNATNTRIKGIVVSAVDYLQSPEEVYRTAASKASVENAKSAAAALISLVCPPAAETEVVTDLFGAKILEFRRPNKTGR